MRIVWFSLSLFLCSINSITQPLKVYAFYTPSHEILVKDWFLPSLEKINEYELVLVRHEQDCPSAQFNQKGWRETMLHKVDVILQGIEESWGEIFIHSDVDILFIRPSQDIVLELMGEDMDLVIQRSDVGPGTLCPGFFAMRANEKTKALWTAIRNQLAAPNNHLNDQDIINYFLRRPTNKFGIKWAYLPTEFFTLGTLTRTVSYRAPWTPNNPIEIPEGIILHHACWTHGVENKIKQLEYVCDQIDFSLQGEENHEN